jgi:hypothetical protein
MDTGYSFSVLPAFLFKREMCGIFFKAKLKSHKPFPSGHLSSTGRNEFSELFMSERFQVVTDFLDVN